MTHIKVSSYVHGMNNIKISAYCLCKHQHLHLCCSNTGSCCYPPGLNCCVKEMTACLIFQDDESEFDHFQDEEEFEGFDSERVGSSGKLDDKEAPKITITKV